MGEYNEYCEVKLSLQPSLTDLSEYDVEGKLEGNDLFLYANSFFFIYSMQKASPFSSLEHTTSFTQDLWFNESPIRSWLDAFSTHRHIGDAISRAPFKLVSARCENNLMVELDITSREEFIFIERELTKLWERLSQEKIQEERKEIGEVVQKSMEEEVVPSNSFDEIVSTGTKASMINYDLNKIPEENESIGVHV
ncbi:hypothetical protein AHAS_Ahas07G0086300 [Arachis hypogaea]